MKLLNIPRQSDLEQLTLRGSEYKIRNLAAPLPNSMTPEDYQKGELMVISHPGWVRVGLLPKDLLSVDYYINRIIHLLNKGGVQKYKNSRELELLRIQLAKGALLSMGGVTYLQEELKTETAIDFAINRDMPVILTVPCDTESHRQYGAVENQSNTFVPYINAQIMRAKKVYVLPTFPDCGRVIGDELQGSQGNVDFAFSESGSRTFGAVLSHPWRKVYFAGGQLRNCLATTIGYFVKQKHVELIDDFCFSSESKRLTNDTEHLIQICRSALPLLADPKKEERTRSALLKLLHPFSPISMRMNDYSEIFKVFNYYGLRKDNCQENPDSQIRVVHIQ